MMFKYSDLFFLAFISNMLDFEKLGGLTTPQQLFVNLYLYTFDFLKAVGH